jgi:signal transduction histidine kinase
LDELKDSLADAKRKVVLIASASHELRTPLNGILNSLEVMRGLLQGELAEYLEVGILSSHYLMNAVNDVLVIFISHIQDYAQIGEGRLKLNYDSFDPKNAVKECVDLMGLEARKKGLKLATTFDRGLPEYFPS